IAIEDYQNNAPNLVDLSNPRQDADELKVQLVSNYSFKEEDITILENPNRSEIINAFENLSDVITEKDNLLIFYAGHGNWDEKLKIGYWLPADARMNSKGNWISNSTVRDYIAGLNTKHTLLISDACFSGSIFKTRDVGKSLDDLGYYRLNKLQSRNAMTSSTLNTVPDDSQFMKYLIKNLKENEKEYLPSKQLFHQIEIAIINNTVNIPQFGTIQNTGDEGGDFIFIREDKK
ncbi:MAG: caspase family protein, partial [Bacteroidota bacterium]